MQEQPPITEGEPRRGEWGRFTVTVGLADLSEVDIDELVPWRVVLEGPDISAEALRKVPLGSIVAETRREVLERSQEFMEHVYELNRRTAAIRHRETRRISSGRRRRGTGQRVNPDLHEVAEVYLMAERVGMPATALVADSWRVGRPTVTRWIQRARALGLLQPEERGE
jgi:hypothetical protein